MTYDPRRYSTGFVPMAQIPHKTEGVRAIRDSFLRAHLVLVELDFSAVEERIMSRIPRHEVNRANGVPLSGRDAFGQGWDTRACPHPPNTLESNAWLTHWHRANEECHRQYVEAKPEE